MALSTSRSRRHVHHSGTPKKGGVTVSHLKLCAPEEARTTSLQLRTLSWASPLPRRAMQAA
ncbi:unnamed protein product [Miscanthus lutarioriparius]|uniref:Uncharacterized protein n=1 Tax=Miscanthus lutarioriparius TaxID=422564 RepID=A0A811QPX4_9POAL|nr:unnamed protein product [Miscanthus lutarioriparius]